MRTTSEALQGVLSKGPLPRACLVTGVEPLLIDEACATIRARARQDGYGEREVHFLEKGFDWDALLADAASLSLFANLRLIELKFRNAPDATAGKNLGQLAANPPQDTLMLVTTPKAAAQAIRKVAGIGWKPTVYMTYASTSVVLVLKPAVLVHAKRHSGQSPPYVLGIRKRVEEVAAERVEHVKFTRVGAIQHLRRSQPGAIRHLETVHPGQVGC